MGEPKREGGGAEEERGGEGVAGESKSFPLPRLSSPSSCRGVSATMEMMEAIASITPSLLMSQILQCEIKMTREKRKKVSTWVKLDP